MSLVSFLKKRFSSDIDEEESQGFGTFFGVYLPGLLNMFGVIIFLRMGWVVGNAGILKSLLIITIASIITFITALSIAASATNMKIGAGGTYFMISRVFGVEIGTAIGLPLYFLQVISISMCIVGFSESAKQFCSYISVQSLGVITLCACTVLALTSAKGAMKTQLIILGIIIISLASLFLGKPIENTSSTIFVGSYSSFWVIFAVFFPAATGIEAGVSMSGNLKNPARSLPIGTIGVILTGYLIYVAISLLFWRNIPREVLVNDVFVAIKLSKYSFLTILGIWAATLSSALANLLAAPRTLQALAKDKSVPHWIANEYGKTKEPRLAVLITFAIAFFVIYFLGSINLLAPVLSMIILISYGMLNLAAGLEGFLCHPSWRPKIKVHWSISFIGSFLCIFVMFMINSGWTFASLLFIAVLYFFIKKRKLSNKWDDLRQGILVFFSRFVIYRLTATKPSTKSWRPHLLVFAENPLQDSIMLTLALSITRRKGFLTFASIISNELADIDKIYRWKKILKKFLKKRGLQALIEVNLSSNIFQGMKRMVGNYGLEALKPNTVLLKENFDSLEFIQVIRHSYTCRKNVIIVKQDEKDTSTLKKGYKLSQVSNIDIWWDDENKQNSELMLVLAHMCQQNSKLKNLNVHIKSLVTNEMAREQRIAYFNSFLSQNRFSIKSKVYVTSDNDSYFSMVNSFSLEDGLVFVGIRPVNEDETDEDYQKYCKEIIKNTNQMQSIIFVMGSENLSLNQLFN